MAWQNVNEQASDRVSAKLVPGTTASRATDDRNVSASKYRVNVLAMTERLLNGRPKRTKRSRRDNSPVCNIGRKLQKPNRVSPLEASGSQENSRSTPLVIQPCSPGMQQHRVPTNPSLEANHKNDWDKIVRDNLEYKVGGSFESRMVDEILNYKTMDVILNYKVDDADWTGALLEPTVVDSPLKLMPGCQSTRREDELESTDYGISTLRKPGEPTTIEHNADGYDSFDDFDDSVFDGISLPALSTDEHVNPRSQDFSFTPLHSLPSEKLSTYPNDAPFPPFMHPCPGDSFNTIVNHGVPLGSTSLEPMLTAFRIVEAEHLISAFKSGQWLPNQEMTFVLFCTISEVKCADSLGQGQDLVLSDVFFTQEPPYISVSCRIPYNAQDLTRRTEQRSTEKPLVKAIIGVSKTRGPKPSRLGPQSASENSVRESYFNREVLDIRLTS